ncbi:MAG: ROK family protein [Saprospiraceae bacterium]
MKKTYFLGIDIGGTKCAVLAGTEQMEILERIQFTTETGQEAEYTIHKLIENASTIINRFKDYTLAAIGISCGGPLDSSRGLIQSPPNLPGWDNIPITQLFEDQFNVPVFLQNDANACALAEFFFGAGKGTNNMIFLTFGTGLGAGLILNGQLYTGTNDLAGEIGHIRLADDGPEGFGKHGSFEGFCSGAGIARMARAMIHRKMQNGEKVSFIERESQLDALTTKDLAEAAAKGDQTAIEIFEISGKYLGIGLSILMDTFNPQRIVIGGVYARNPHLFEKTCTEVIEKEAIPAAAKVCEVVPAALGNQVGDYASLSVAIMGNSTVNRTKNETNQPVQEKLEQVLEQTLTRHPLLSSSIADIKEAFNLLCECYSNNHKLLICGNGGSAADSEHIVGELMKSFTYNRVLSNEIKRKLAAVSKEKGTYLAEKLQPTLRAISLTCHNALNTAFSNDVDPKLVFAQQVIGYGDPGDVLLAISTSGNSENVLNAVLVAKAIGLRTIGLTGKMGGQLKEICDVTIGVDGTETADVQELHLPVYHALCKMLEKRFFDQL